MNKKILVLLILSLILSCTYSAMFGFAINRDTSSCAHYWAGDETNNYPLPAGWQDYYYSNGDWSGSSGVLTECHGMDEYSCCETLGFSFVNTSNIATMGTLASYEVQQDIAQNVTNYGPIVLAIIALIVAVVIIFLIVRTVIRWLKKRKEDKLNLK